MQVYKVYDIVGESSSSIIKYSENDMMQRDQWGSNEYNCTSILSVKYGAWLGCFASPNHGRHMRNRVICPCTCPRPRNRQQCSAHLYRQILQQQVESDQRWQRIVLLYFVNHVVIGRPGRFVLPNKYRASHEKSRNLSLYLSWLRLCKENGPIRPLFVILVIVWQHNHGTNKFARSYL